MSDVKELMRSKKIAIIISYFSLIFHTLNNIILTPIYIKYLGLEQYGLYQMIYTVASYILILDFGIQTTMVRYISRFHIQNDYESEKDFAAHCLILLSLVALGIITVGGIINAFLLKIYPTITDEESHAAHTMFIVMIIILIATLIERFLQGSLQSYENFVVCNGINVIKLIIKLILTILLITGGVGVVSIVIVDFVAINISCILLFLYSKRVIKFKVQLLKFKKKLIAEMLLFMFPIFLQAIVGYVSSYVDKTILGIMTVKSDVAIYSVAMVFITFFNSLPTAISSVFLPQANKLIYGTEYTRASLTEFVSRPGRYSFIMCAGMIGGFICFGKEFICLWAGESTVSAWHIALIIMIPNMIPLIENTVLSIQDALNKRLFRSVILIVASFFNIIVSVILVHFIGMEGAPIGTALSFVIAYGIILNVYYDKKLNIDVIKMFQTIVNRTWVCTMAPIALVLPLNLLLSMYSWWSLALKCVVFIIVYGLMLWIYGLNRQEKAEIKDLIRKCK